MSTKDCRKLKPGDTVRLKTDGTQVTVTGREESGRVVYGERHGQKIVLRNEDVRKESRRDV